MGTIFTAATRGDGRGRPKGGLLILFNARLYKVETLFKNDSIIFISVSVRKFYSRFIIGLTYFNPSSSINEELEMLNNTLITINQNFVNTPIFIGGDMNSRVGDLNQLDRDIILFNNNLTNIRSSCDKEINNRGIKLVEGFESMGLFLLNGRAAGDIPAAFTFRNSIGGKSSIDLVWTNLYSTFMINELKIFDIISKSDHFPVALSLNIEREVNFPRSKYKWKDQLESEYVIAMTSSLQTVQTECDPNLLSIYLVNTIKNVAKNVGMISNFNDRIGLSKPWFDSECLESKKLFKKMLKECRTQNFPPEMCKVYNNHNKNYANLLEKKKKTYNDYRLEILASAKDPTSFWKIVNTFRRKSNIPDLVDLKTWGTFLKETFPPRCALHYLLNDPEYSNEIIDVPITKDEIIKSLI